MILPIPPHRRADQVAALNDLSCPHCDAGATAAHVVPAFDCRAFRDTLGSFATGVTVVTALAPNGERIGLTISSFNSVSLDPPLILWSLSRQSPNIDAFRSASRYVVNVLSVGQEDISNRFAARGDDRFAGVAVREGLGGVPMIEGCCAYFECANDYRYPGGDHTIFVGRVERFTQGEEQLPLVFHGGRYRQLEVVFDETLDED